MAEVKRGTDGKSLCYRINQPLPPSLKQEIDDLAQQLGQNQRVFVTRGLAFYVEHIKKQLAEQAA